MNGILDSSVATAKAIRTKRVSCEEVAKWFIGRIEQANGKTNAIIATDPDLIIAEARQRDMEIATGAYRGPVHGLPFTVKDCFSTDQYHTTCGSEYWKDFFPKSDAAVVSRLRRSGAVLIGKTNLSPFLSRFEADNTLFGRTCNPYSLDRSAGGSSGGEAASVAATESSFGVGSDRGGSIRVPCHFCGVIGLKPTVGTLPAKGHLPMPTGPVKTEPGPIARTVADLRLIMAVLTGRGTDSIDGVRGLRVAFSYDCGGADPDESVANALGDSVRTLEREGCHLKESTPPGLSICEDLIKSITAVRGQSCGDEVMPEFIEPVVRTPEDMAALAELWVERAHQLAANSSMSGCEYYCQEIRIDVLRARLDEFMESYDAILCPVTGSTALPHGFSRDPSKGALRPNTFLYSLTGNPAMSVPVGRDDLGLPVGIQIVARRSDEETVYRIGSLLEKHLGGWVAPLI